MWANWVALVHRGCLQLQISSHKQALNHVWRLVLQTLSGAMDEKI